MIWSVLVAELVILRIVRAINGNWKCVLGIQSWERCLILTACTAGAIRYAIEYSGVIEWSVGIAMLLLTAWRILLTARYYAGERRNRAQSTIDPPRS